jgi:HSP20 family molecular chaperone IbpA
VVRESLKLRVEEEREYYSVVAALPGVRKQGMCALGV